MQSAKLLVLLFGLFILPHIIHAQSPEVPVRIAYIRESFDENGVITGAYLLENGEERLISGDYGFTIIDFAGLAWSPDCSQFIFNAAPAGQDPGNVQEVILYDTETEALTQLSDTADLGQVYGLRWSPVDDRIYFRVVDYNADESYFFIGSVDSMTFDQFFSGHYFDSVREWSPDGNALFIRVIPESSTFYELYMVDLKSPGYETIGIYSDLAFVTIDASSDGNTLVMLAGPSSTASDIYLMNIATQEMTNLTNAPAGYINGSWSPSNEQIAFVVDTDVHVIDADGSNWVNLTASYNDVDFSHVVALYGWTGDGEYLIFEGEGIEDTFYTDLFAVSADGAELIRLTTSDPELSAIPSWYPCMLPTEESN